jgi:hypothetical protein
MDNLMEQFYESGESGAFETDIHTGQLVREAQASSSSEVQVLARRLAETHDDMQRLYEILRRAAEGFAAF